MPKSSKSASGDSNGQKTPWPSVAKPRAPIRLSTNQPLPRGTRARGRLLDACLGNRHGPGAYAAPRPSSLAVMRQAPGEAVQKLCPSCSTLAYTGEPRCPWCGAGYRRRLWPGLLALLLVQTALVLGGVAYMLAVVRRRARLDSSTTQVDRRAARPRRLVRRRAALGARGARPAPARGDDRAHEVAPVGAPRRRSCAQSPGGSRMTAADEVRRAQAASPRDVGDG